VVAEFLKKNGPIFDVRSPLEYKQGHIPGAINLPLFTDEERALVGTCYKKVGQKAAIELGVQLVGPQLHGLLTLAKSHMTDAYPTRIYCFRGGMRSGFVSWFFNFVGYTSITLKGGYKAFRRFVLDKVNGPCQLQVLGGFTGSGKTQLLETWRHSGKQIIDLEALANHRGSAFGLSYGDSQPTTEHFENRLAICLAALDMNQIIWVEDESRQIGNCTIPNGFFDAMKTAPLTFLECPIEQRIENIIQMYGSYPPEYLMNCTEKIKKKLGSEKTLSVLQHIREGSLHEAVKHLLEYYDKSYYPGCERAACRK